MNASLFLRFKPEEPFDLVVFLRDTANLNCITNINALSHNNVTEASGDVKNEQGKC